MSNINSSVVFLEEVFHDLVLGIVQGLTEFLPISSTAHLKVVPLILGWGDPGVSLTAALQLGSVFAVIAYFWNDLGLVLKGIFKAFFYGRWDSPEARLGFSILLGTIPIVLAGTFIKLFWPGYEQSILRTIPVIGFVSIIMAILLTIAENTGSRKKGLKDVRPLDGIFVGFFQVIALIPGVSRSGITLTSALFAGMNRRSAARLSFLLGIPAITLAGISELRIAIGQSSIGTFIPFMIGLASAAITSWISIDFLLKFLQRNSTYIFVIYRLFFGIALISWSYLYGQL